jgi:hypothetical protein
MSNPRKKSKTNNPPQINIECLVEDYDLSGKVTRDLFEELCEPLKEKLETLIDDILQKYGERRL